MYFCSSDVEYLLPASTIAQFLWVNCSGNEEKENKRGRLVIIKAGEIHFLKRNILNLAMILLVSSSGNSGIDSWGAGYNETWSFCP